MNDDSLQMLFVAMLATSSTLIAKFYYDRVHAATEAIRTAQPLDTMTLENSSHTPEYGVVRGTLRATEQTIETPWATQKHALWYAITSTRLHTRLQWFTRRAMEEQERIPSGEVEQAVDAKVANVIIKEHLFKQCERDMLLEQMTPHVWYERIVEEHGELLKSIERGSIPDCIEHCQYVLPEGVEITVIGHVGRDGQQLVLQALPDRPTIISMNTYNEILAKQNAKEQFQKNLYKMTLIASGIAWACTIGPSIWKLACAYKNHKRLQKLRQRRNDIILERRKTERRIELQRAGRRSERRNNTDSNLSDEQARTATSKMPLEKADSFYSSESESETDRLCLICTERKTNAVLLECGHFHFCMTCASKLSICAVCRMPISKIIKAYGE